MEAPERNVYPRDASFIWNGKNNRHCCNECRCLFCTALRWVVLPHCNCKLPYLSMGLPLDARIRRKRITCRHLPRHKTTPLGYCPCVVSGTNSWNALLDTKECDIRMGNLTGDIPHEDKFIGARMFDKRTKSGCTVEVETEWAT
ncbi:hypothetical protein KC19_5G004200 [Ceratodon purpureus]|uniref:Uncharacterized protein n=1 Tax=Ceratodon purpureus TaxID=3225 RepID=A0A8T0HWF3_CERPU|nr:hypothetical protein KC19_5G004200 [Ceratodon purpureus]